MTRYGGVLIFGAALCIACGSHDADGSADATMNGNVTNSSVSNDSSNTTGPTSSTTMGASSATSTGGGGSGPTNSGTTGVNDTSTSSSSTTASSVSRDLEGCSVFPADNPWNTDISTAPVHPNSDNFIDSIGRSTTLHPDFGTEWESSPIGIPYTSVKRDQAKVEVSFDYGDESDPGPYPIPPDAPIEGGADSDGDRHVLVVDTDDCMLYELFGAHPVGGGASWQAASGAIFALGSNALRPERWTSADAAGLPILPGLVRYDEVVEKREIGHALRFTVSQSQAAYIHPATHAASSSTDANRPPMGLRVRMKADYDCTDFSDEVQVICAALKRYGMFVADNGSNWYVSGAHDPRWSDDNLRDLGQIPGDAFEVVDTGPIIAW